MVLQLNADGSGIFDGELLRYSVSENVLAITMGAKSITYFFSLNEKQLTLSGGDFDGMVIFFRASDPTFINSSTERPSAFSSTSRELIGLWSGGGEMIEFRTDGNCRYNGGLFPYSVSQGHIIIEATSGKAIFQYAIVSNKLVLTTNGQQAVYTRPANSTAQPKPGARNPVELAGQWCYMNMTSGAQSGRCVTLSADGTYLYSAERSRSVTTMEGSGGISSQSEDSGTWYVAGDRMYYQSRSGESGSYRLEKRNHPRNVNDPMIVLDDEPFVTTTQRRPGGKCIRIFSLHLSSQSGQM